MCICFSEGLGSPFHFILFPIYALLIYFILIILTKTIIFQCKKFVVNYQSKQITLPDFDITNSKSHLNHHPRKDTDHKRSPN